ncbi:MAG: hypothetical protein KAS04_01360, partial [Candidatus Aenigmarchaeota archaeon]|nr:hypothetical protein [Candidatus Aenigmarchaeota archaeon]
MAKKNVKKKTTKAAKKRTKKPAAESKKKPLFDIGAIKKEIKKVTVGGKTSKVQTKSSTKKMAKGKERHYVKVGIDGFDSLFEYGIPKGSSILVAGGAGSGKTIFCLQMIADAAMKGEKCLYMSFEESEE